MALRLSRRRLARYIATAAVDSKQDVAKAITLVAAYLYVTGRTREVELVGRDVEAALADQGITIASVTSAHSMSDSLKQNITALVGGDVRIRETVDPSVLGGVKVDVPGKRFDGTIRHKLDTLKAKQV